MSKAKDYTSRAMYSHVDGIAKWLTCVMALLTAFALAGCASAPRPVLPSDLVLLIDPSENLNPDLNGRASPVMVRIYELKSPTQFESADFFALQEKDSAQLSGDLVNREEIVVLPHKSTTIKRRTGPETRVLAVMAAYRDLEKSVWRAVYVLPPATEGSRYFGNVFGNEPPVHRLTVKLDEKKVTLAASTTTELLKVASDEAAEKAKQVAKGAAEQAKEEAASRTRDAAMRKLPSIPRLPLGN